MVGKYIGKVHPKIEQRYIDSGVWKCPDAPIDPNVPLQVAEQCGAHYWIGMKGDSGQSYCKYCYMTRKLG